MTSIEERCRWDRLYGLGDVTEELPNAAQKMRVDLWMPGGHDVIHRFMNIMRCITTTPDGTYICLSQSVLPLSTTLSVSLLSLPLYPDGECNRV